MALTLGAQTRYSVGARYETVTPITVDNSYPTGGWALTAANLGCPLGLVDSVRVEGTGTTSAGAVPNAVYNKAAGTLQVYAANTVSAVGAQATNATDFSAGLPNLVVTAVGR